MVIYMYYRYTLKFVKCVNVQCIMPAYLATYF